MIQRFAMVDSETKPARILKMLYGKLQIKNNTFTAIIIFVSLISDDRFLDLLPIVAAFAKEKAKQIKIANRTIEKAKKLSEFSNKIGLESVTAFSSNEGITLYPDHSYELILEVNNTSNVNQDMMASMFLFFYDVEMHEKLKSQVGL